jgi:pyruvate formate lyase activating enzyme
MSNVSQSKSIEAASPFEMRLDQSLGVQESIVKNALATGDIGFLHSFTTGSTVDGPGVRVVAWTAGCQWRCLYCHNPDTWNMMNGRAVTLERAVEELSKYRHGLQAMHGGFTLSGGEPLMQDRFAVRLFGAARNLGIHTTIETNGFLGNRLTDAELETIDLVMLGIKSWGDDHRHLTGKDIGPTLDFARRLAQRRKPMWIRFVLVPGLTDRPETIASIGQFAASLGNVERLEVLPFHQMGRFKWRELGLDYKLADAQAPTPEAIEHVCQQFRAAGVNAD